MINACKDDNGNIVDYLFNNAVKLAKYNHPQQDIQPSRIIFNCNKGFKGENHFSQEAFDSPIKLLDNGFSYGDTAYTVDAGFDWNRRFNPRVIELAIEHKDIPQHLTILHVSRDGTAAFNENFYNKVVNYTENHNYSQQDLGDFKSACLDNSLKFNETAIDTGLKFASDYYDNVESLTEASQLLEKCKDKSGMFNKDALESLTKDLPKYQDNYFDFLSSRLESSLNSKGEFEKDAFDFYNYLAKTYFEEPLNVLSGIVSLARNNEGVMDKSSKDYLVSALGKYGLPYSTDLLLHLKNKKGNLNQNAVKAREKMEKDFEVTEIGWLGCLKCKNETYPDDIYEAFKYFKKHCGRSFKELTENCKNKKGEFAPKIFEFEKKLLKNTVKAISLVGEKAMTYAFSFKKDALVDYQDNMASLAEELSPEMKEIFLKNVNPTNSKEYKTLQEEQRVLKNNLQKQLSAQDKTLMSESKNTILAISKENSELKNKINENQLPETKKQELLKKIKANNQEIMNHKLSLQKISDKHPNLQKRINEIDIKLRNLKENAVKDPKSLVEISNIFHAFCNKENSGKEKYLKQLLPYLNPQTQEEKELYTEQLNKLMFKNLKIKYDKTTAQKLNLTKSPYLGELFNVNYSFNNNLAPLINVIKTNRELTVAQALAALPQNIETKRQFDAIGIDYDKWVNVDKNSYVRVDIQTDEESAQKAAIRNLEADFNDVDFKKLPQDEQERLLGVIKQNGVELVSQQETVYDEDGYVDGQRDVSRMHKNGKPLEFDMLEKLVTALKQDINSNPFWDSFEDGSDELFTAKSTIYNHLVKLRYTDVKNALKVKGKKTVEMEVHKTDMNNIAHALFLGNQASCCTAVGTGSNQFSAPNYIKNKLISAIEVMDGSNFVGNTMCYFAKINGETSLVLDNIELSSQYQYSDKIRDAILEYAKKLTVEVGKPDMPIYAGPNRHKVDMSNYKLKKENMTIIGSTGVDSVYLDFDAQAHKIDGKKNNNVSLYKIK